MSRLIKPEQYITVEQKKIIESLLKLAGDESYAAVNAPGQISAEDQQQIHQANGLKEQILEDAEQLAEARVRQAQEEADQLKAQAQLEIEQWWNERRKQDEQETEAARQDGYKQGYEAGLIEAEHKIREQCEQQIQEARSLLEQAYEEKRQIISDAEPFLIELSTQIAEKITHRELASSPEWVASLTKEMLARKRERGVITLCVAPQQYSYMKSMHEELAQTIDSQAELRIVPDLTVRDMGCVVRSELGTLDARIQTQLNEIKQAMLQLANMAGQEAETGREVADERYA